MRERSAPSASPGACPRPFRHQTRPGKWFAWRLLTRSNLQRGHTCDVPTRTDTPRFEATRAPPRPARERPTPTAPTQASPPSVVHSRQRRLKKVTTKVMLDRLPGKYGGHVPRHTASVTRHTSGPCNSNSTATAMADLSPLCSVHRQPPPPSPSPRVRKTQQQLHRRIAHMAFSAGARRRMMRALVRRLRPHVCIAVVAAPLLDARVRGVCGPSLPRPLRPPARGGGEPLA